MKIEEIKKEFDIKISHAFGEDPRGFKIYCFECDDGVDKEGLWKWIETKLLLIKRDTQMELEVEIGLQKFRQLMAEKEKIRREAVKDVFRYLQNHRYSSPEDGNVSWEELEKQYFSWENKQ